MVTGSTDDIPVLLLAASTDLPLAASGELVQNTAVPALTAIDGVRLVEVTGEDTTQLTVTLRPADLTKNDLTAAAVTQSIQSQLTVIPAGTAYDKTLELAVQVGNSTTSIKQVQALAVPTSDGPIALSQIADVKVESISSSSLARSDGRPALSVSVLKETGGDSVAISHAVADAIPGLEKTMGNNAAFNIVFDQAPLIEQSIHDLTVEGALGLSFAVLVILLFLLSLRSTIITAISIPLSLLIAMIGLQVGGFSLNIFTLAALTVAVGRVVDDSIVVLENIKRRDTGHAALTPADIVASVKEVAGAVTASTATTVAVFLPVAVVSGVTGELFRPFAVTIAVALVASLLVSMTVVPVLAYWFLRGGKRKRAAAAAAAATAAATAGDSRGTPAGAGTGRLPDHQRSQRRRDQGHPAAEGLSPGPAVGSPAPRDHSRPGSHRVHRHPRRLDAAEDRLPRLVRRRQHPHDPAGAAGRHPAGDDECRGEAGRGRAGRGPRGQGLPDHDRRQHLRLRRQWSEHDRDHREPQRRCDRGADEAEAGVPAGRAGEAGG